MPQYQGVWTLQNQAQAQSNQQWVTDPNFKNTTLLLQADGVGSGSQNNTFLDGSTNNFFITRNGNTTQGSFTPFSQAPGYWGNYFNGSSTSYLNAVSNAVFTFGTGDFTLEAFIYMPAYPTSGTVAGNIICAHDWNGATGFDFTFRIGQTGLLYFENDSSQTVTASTAVPLNTWAHVACVRSSGTVTLYANGVSVGSGSAAASITSATAVSIGNALSGGLYGNFNGYISNARVTKGGALYTGTFTPSTTPLTTTVSSGTVSLLTCQSNRFIDNSVNAFALTAGANTSVQAFGPFAPQYQWTSDVIGGSGYFDGTGDYLTGPSASGGDFSTGSFTISCWFYPTTLTGGVNHGLMSYADTGGWNGWQLQVRGSTKDILFEFLTGSAGASTITGGSIALNAWNYVAIVRSGSTVSMYVNSTTAATSTTNSTAYGAASSRVIVGADRNLASLFIGYVSSAKLVKQANTPASIPTAPDTNTTNTSLLLNYTNAGIYDGTMKNNLETVGNAQVSTSVVKNGSGSIYLSGVSPYSYFKGSPTLAQTVAFGSADFTVELWVYLTTTASDSVIIDTRAGSNAGNYFLFYLWTSGGTQQPTISWYVPTSYVLNTGSPVPANQWVHIAVSRANGILRSFLNGVLQQSAANTTVYANPGSSYPSIGAAYGAGTDSFKGYMDDFRITYGVARYIANFTPPQQALPRQ